LSSNFVFEGPVISCFTTIELQALVFKTLIKIFR